MTLVRPCTVPGLGEQDAAGRAGEPLYLDQAQLTRLQVQAGHVVSEVPLVDVVDLAAAQPRGP